MIDLGVNILFLTDKPVKCINSEYIYVYTCIIAHPGVIKIFHNSLKIWGNYITY